MVTLQQINCFISVAKSLNFARAAEELYISQSAVSHHIISLERELGAPLFIRTKHYVALTEAGERFFLEMLDVKNQLDMAIETVQSNVKLPDSIHIGFENSLEIFKLPVIFSEYIKKRPNTRIYCHGLQFDAAMNMFNENKLDVLFTTFPGSSTEGEEFLALFEGHMCCVMRNDDPLAQKETVCPDDLDSRALIFAENRNCAPEMAAFQRKLHLQHPTIQVHFSSTPYYSMPLVQAGVGIVILPDFFFTQRENQNGSLVSIPFESELSVRFGLLWHNKYINAKVKDFVSLTASFYSGSRGCFSKQKL